MKIISLEPRGSPTEKSKESVRDMQILDLLGTKNLKLFKLLIPFSSKSILISLGIFRRRLDFW